uniref:Interleukin-12 subunit alpha n=1 Tax=Malurus cyaneus samueli TaxID=2593467 RepID=A0A8C5TYX7_9PASS
EGTDGAVRGSRRAGTGQGWCSERGNLNIKIISIKYMDCVRKLPTTLFYPFFLPQERGSLGFECTLDEVDLEDITENKINTITACTAEDAGPGNCPALDILTFDKGKCLQGISEDLRAYRAELKNLSDPQVLASLDGMMDVISPFIPLKNPGSGLGSFPERLRLCSVLQAFRIRSVTISRMMNFLSSL